MGSQPASDLPNPQGRDHFHPPALLGKTRTQHSAPPGGLQQEARKSQRTRWGVLLLIRGAVLQGGTLAGHSEINRPGLEGNTHSLPSRGREEGSQGNFGWYTAGGGGAGPEVGVPPRAPPHHLQGAAQGQARPASVLGGVAFSLVQEATLAFTPTAAFSATAQVSPAARATQDQRGGTFPGGSVVKNPPAGAGDTGSIPGWGRFHRRSD